MEKTGTSETQNKASSSSGRRAERVKLCIPIRVMCFGGSAGDFLEDTHTLVVNRDGALIVLQHKVTPEETLRIINLENFREADFRVVGQTRLEGAEASQWGVECLEKDRTLWDIDFPPPLDLGGTSAGALLECLACNKQSLIVLSLVEVDMLEAAGTIQRLCDKCGHLSSWSFADTTHRPKDLWSPAQPPVSPRVGLWDGKTERRRYRRAGVKMRALVRSGKGEPEIVKTENLSKGGLSVCLKMTLALGDLVTVICPYSGSGQDFEQKAEVRYRAPHAGGQNWFYGLIYVLK